MVKRSMSQFARGVPRRARRVIAVATLLGLPGSYAWYAFWSSTTVPKAAWGFFSFVLILVSAIGAVFLYARAGSDKRLDERERQMRDRAWVLAYVILSVGVIAAFLVASVIVLGLDRTIVIDGRVMSGAATCFGVLVPVLPYAALAWLEPDAPVED